MTPAERRLRYRLAHPERIAESHRRYRASPKRKESNRRFLESDAGRAYKARVHAAESPERKAVWHVVDTAVRAGRLVRESCRDCPRTDTHAHHHKGYDNPLDVVWLCPLHHRHEHGFGAEP